jgi:hypothetical protein
MALIRALDTNYCGSSIISLSDQRTLKGSQKKA